jgi:hypothetical protein
MIPQHMKLVSTNSQNMIGEISGLRRDLVEASALLGCCVPYVNGWIPSLTGNIMVASGK